jgi:hypothetical protein
MTTQLWLTTVVAVVGNVTVVLNGILSGILSARNATRLAERARKMDHLEYHRKEFDSARRQFLSAARRLMAADTRPRADDVAAALTDLRNAIAAIESYRPELADDTLNPALTAVERLADLRAKDAFSASVNEANQTAQHALTKARTTLTTDLRGVLDPT